MTISRYAVSYTVLCNIVHECLLFGNPCTMYMYVCTLVVYTAMPVYTMCML